MGKQIDTLSAIAFNNNESFGRGNTSVVVDKKITKLIVLGHTIATKIRSGKSTELILNSCGYKSALTLRRLKGIDRIFLESKGGDWYINNVKWNGKEIELKY
tara:strand:- start:145 stop:450 length:306 start_codon:yes stop_codon:yes gene_type:complete